MKTIIQGIKLFLKFSIIPLYFILFFAGVFDSRTLRIGIFVLNSGLVLHFVTLFTGMWAFSDRKRPLSAYLLAGFFLVFYLILYWTNRFDVLAQTLYLKNRWVFYGLIYTLLVLLYGGRFIWRHRHDRYQVMRTVSVMSVQLLLSFLLPLIMPLFKQPEYYFSYFWPLKIEYFYPEIILTKPLPIIIYSFLGSLVLVPILSLLVGKRFYCSWVCGCGGLAETFGDRWRQLSNKTRAAWNFERVSIYTVLGFAVAGTAAILLNAYLKNRLHMQTGLLDVLAFRFRSLYGFVFGAVAAGAVGVGFYPVLGSRVWCRFFCPLAAMMGLIQKAGRFHIRVKPDMCISCGNCSAFCEMGIDVRMYAQRNESFTRAACVGCGMCAYVCPRGVLRLENKPLFKQTDS